MPKRITFLSLARDSAVAPLFASRVAGRAGDGFGQLALAWGTLQLGYGATGLSLVLACKAVPAFMVLAGGILGDRFRRHQVLAGADALSAVAWVALAGCFLAGAAPLAVVCALAALAGVARALGLPAAGGIVADLVHRAHRQTANALLTQSESVGLLIGLISSGVVVAAVGPEWAAMLKAVLAACGAGLLMRLETPIWSRDRAKPLADLRAGWREFASRQWVWVITIQLTAVAVAVSSFSGVIGPLHLADRPGGARAWGIVAGCEALGALLGAIVAARWRPSRPLLATACLPFSAAAPMLLLGCGAPWPALAAAMVLPGICQTAYFVLWFTVIQGSFAPGLLARVNSWVILGNFVLTPVTLFAAGPVAGAIGTGSAAFGCALVIVTATAMALLSPQIRRFGAATEPDPRTGRTSHPAKARVAPDAAG